MIGVASTQWTLEQLRADLGYAGYLGAMNEPQLLRMSVFLGDFPFADRLYHGARDSRNVAAYLPTDLTV